MGVGCVIWVWACGVLPVCWVVFLPVRWHLVTFPQVSQVCSIYAKWLPNCKIINCVDKASSLIAKYLTSPSLYRTFISFIVHHLSFPSLYNFLLFSSSPSLYSILHLLHCTASFISFIVQHPSSPSLYIILYILHLQHTTSFLFILTEEEVKWSRRVKCSEWKPASFRGDRLHGLAARVYRWYQGRVLRVYQGG